MYKDLWTHANTFVPGPEIGPQARRFVQFHLRSHGLGDLWTTMALVVQEMSANAARNGGSWCTVELFGNGHSVLYSTRYLPHEEARGPTDALPLALMRELSDRCGTARTHDGTTMVWADFDLNGLGPEPTPGGGAQ